MRLRRREFLLISGAALLPGCKTAGFKDLFLSGDKEGRRRTKTFPPEFAEQNAGIFCHITYSTGRDDAQLRIYFIAPTEGTVALLDGGDIFLGRGEGKLVLQLAVITDKVSDDPKAKPTISPRGPWELGDYQLQFFIDGEKEDSINFVVAEPEPGEAPPT